MITTDIDTQLQKIQTIHPDAARLSEGGIPIVFLPNFTFQAKEGIMAMDLLLYPSSHSGYPTRLFFEQRLQGKEACRWSEHYVAGRNWWAHSWDGVAASLPWLKILFAHLEAVK